MPFLVLSVHEGHEMCQHNVWVCDLLVPVHTYKAFIVQGPEGSQELGHRKLTFSDEDSFLSVAVSKAYKADIGSKSLDCGLSAFAGTEEGFPCVPCGAQGS